MAGDARLLPPTEVIIMKSDSMGSNFCFLFFTFVYFSILLLYLSDHLVFGTQAGCVPVIQKAGAGDYCQDALGWPDCV